MILSFIIANHHFYHCKMYLVSNPKYVFAFMLATRVIVALLALLLLLASFICSNKPINIEETCNPTFPLRVGLIM